MEELSTMQMVQWVWQGDGFAKISEVTSKNRMSAGRNEIIYDRGGAIDLKPYVYPVCIVCYLRVFTCFK